MIQRAMLIDDEEIDQRQYQRIINRSGLVEELLIFSYADLAFEFLSRADRPKIDVIFLDINMPRMNGFEFLDAFESSKMPLESVVIFMLSTSLEPADRKRALSYDAVRDFINKPLMLEHVQRALDLVSAKKPGG